MLADLNFGGVLHCVDLPGATLADHICALQVSSGEVKKTAPPRMYVDVEPSPDSSHLLVSWFERPFSFTVPCGRFPRRTQLWDR